MQKTNRVLIIGLDGATWDVLGPWLDDGTLPNLGKLRTSGSWGNLLSSIPPISAPAWSTFMTGKQPGKHGVFHFVNLFGEDKTTGDALDIMDARSLKSSTLWDIMGHYGHGVTLINVPMTYPPRPVHGFMITGLLTPRNASTFTYPPELSRELTDYIIDLDRFIDKKPGQEGSFDPEATEPNLSLIRDFHDMLEKRTQASLSLMDSKPWSLFVVVFTGTDRMGHYLWPYHRSADPNDLPEVQKLCRAVHQYYIHLDEVVGKLIKKAGEDVAVIVMSDHGMGPQNTKRVHWNYWLYQRDWLSTKQESRRVTNPDNWLKWLGLPRDKISRFVRRIPRLAKGRLVERMKSSAPTVDMDQSQAYCVPIFNNIVGIRINLEGESKETLYQEIVKELEKIVDPETGESVVQRVYRGKDCYHGPYANNIPDIIVSIKPEYNCGYRIGHYSSVVTRVQTLSDQAYHRLEGILIISGPGVASNSEPLAGLSIEDIAPTVLYLVGLPIPSDMDGHVLTETLTPTILESRSIRLGEPVGLWPNEDQAVFSDEIISDEDEVQIRERLQALGYIE